MKNYTILFLLVLTWSFSKSQDIIINTKNNTIKCVIQKIDDTGISFVMPPEDDEYRIEWSNVSQVYYKNEWMKLDSIKGNIEQPVQLIDTANIRKNALAGSTHKIDNYRYLEKAGNNLLLGITLPIGGAIVGGAIILARPDSEGAIATGYLILGSASLIGFICDLSAASNLIKSQRYIDHLLNTNTTGFKIGGLNYGIGLGYRF